MTTADHQQKIFISYARDGGGREFAHAIHKELAGYGFNIWQDIEDIEIGEGWFQQLLQNIEDSVAMVLVLNDAAVESKNVRAEIEHARAVGTPILPVTLDKTVFDNPKTPRWVSKVDVCILDKDHADYAPSHERLLKQLNDPPARKPRPFHTPTLPDHYVQREAEYYAVRDQLLTDNDDTMVAITTALQGGGGFGKTTLARALCLDEEVRFRFDDGVLWVTLGENPDMLTVVNRLIKTLKPDSDTYSDINLAAGALADLFDTRDCLLVIDDVWHEKYLPSLTRSKKATYLITTRLQTVVSYARADAVTVDEMTTDEASTLLAKQIGGDVNPDDLRDMAERLGEWALLLEIVGAELRNRIQNGRTLDNALGYVQKRFERKGIHRLNQYSEDERNQAVRVSLEMSLDRLRDTVEFPLMPDMPDNCDKRFLELGIFKDDAMIPFSTIELLWQQTADFDDLDTEDALEAMASLSLFTRYDPNTATLTLHDVTREILLLLLDESDDMPDAQALHQTLIEAWDIPVYGRNSDPPLPKSLDEITLPDQYAWEQVAYHLIEAGQAEALVALLTDYHWLYAKLSNTNPNAIISDCDLCLDVIKNIAVGTRHALSLQDDAENVVRLIQSAIRLASHIIGDDVEQLSSQLVGRLVGHKGHYLAIDTLMQTIHDLPKPDLLFLHPTLPQAGGALQRTLVGHERGVEDVAISGEVAVTASDDKTVRVWNWHTGEHIRTLEGHTASVTSVALSGEVAVTASDDYTLRVWNWHTGAHIRTLEGHSHWVNSVALSGEVAISASNDYTLRVWNWQTGEHIRTLEGHTNSVTSVALSGEVAVTASYDNMLRVWNWHTGEHIRTLEGHTNSVTSVALSGEVAVSTSQDKTLRVWNWHTGAHIRTLEGHTNSVTSVALSGEVAVSTSQDKTLRVWNWKTGEVMHTLEGHTDYIHSVALVDEYVVSASSDRTLRVWNWKTGEVLRALKGHTSAITSVALSGEVAVSTSHDETLQVWKLPSQSSRETEPYKFLKVLEGHKGSIRSVALSGEVAVTSSWDKTVRVWNWQTGAHIHTLEGHTNFVNSVALSGEVAISASDDKTVRVWNWQTGAHIRTLEGHTNSVTSVALSGKFAISASHDHTVRVWNWQTGAHIRTLEGHTRPVTSVALSGEVAVSTSQDKTLRVWNWTNGELLDTFPREAKSHLTIAPKYNGLSLTGGNNQHPTLNFVHFGNRVLMHRKTSDTVLARVTVNGLRSFGANEKMLVLGDNGGTVHFLRIKGTNPTP